MAGTKITTALELVDNISGNLIRITKSAAEFTASFNEAGEAVQELNGMEIDIDCSAAVEKTNNVLDALAELGDRCSETSENADDFGKDCVKAINSVGSALKVMAIAGGVAEIAGKLLDAADGAGEFETSMAKISTIANTSGGSLESMKESIRNLSLETGESVNNISNSVYKALSAGVDSADAVNFTATATKLATGSFTEVSTAIDVLSTALNAYGSNAGEAEGMADMLITTQNLSKTSVDQFAGAISSVIPLAANYGVQMDNIASAYVELTNSGIQASQAGTYIESMLTELGNSGSAAAQALRDQTGSSFKSLMEQGYSLGDVLNTLGEYVDGDVVKFNGLWSSQEAGAGAMALYNAGAAEFNTTMAAMGDSAGAAASAYEAVAGTSENAKQSMVNAIENMSNAIGEDLNPALTSLYGAGEKLFTGIGNLIESSPKISGAIAGFAVAVTVAATALTAFAVVTCPTVQAAVAALTATMAKNPFFLGVTLVTSLVAGFIAFCSVLNDTENEVNQLTTASRRQYYELQDLNDQYDKACEFYGENSEEASRLKYQIDDLTESFEANKKTIEEVIAEGEELQSAYDETINKYNDTVSSIENETTSTFALVQKLKDLADATGGAADNTEAMRAVYNRLNESFPSLGYSFETATANIDEYAQAVKNAAQSSENIKLKTGLLEDELDYTEQIAKEENYLATLEKLRDDAQNAYDAAKNDKSGKGIDRIKARTAAREELEKYNQAFEESKKRLDGYNTQLGMVQAQLENLQKQQQEAIAGVNNLGTAEATAAVACDTAVSVSTEALGNLKTAYDEAYNSAFESIQGQIGLFDEMKTSSELSVSDMISNLESQSTYLENYTANLKKARDLGLNEDLIQKLSDGSAESAGYLDQIVNNGTGKIAELNAAYEDSVAKQAEWAAAVAAQDANVQLGVEETLTSMYNAIIAMDITDEAKTQAQTAANAYIAELTGMDLTQVEAVGNQIWAALKPPIEETETTEETTPITSVEDITSQFDNIDLETTGVNILEGLIEGMESKTEDVKTTAGTVADSVKGTVEEAMEIESPSKVMYGIGEYIVQGMIDGMNSMHGALVEAAIKMARTIKEKVSNEMEIKSPSRVMYGIGEYIVEGTANGINDNIDESRRAALNLSDSLDISGSAIKTLKGYSSEKTAGSSGDVTIQIDMSNMKNEIKSDDDIDGFITKLEDKLTERFYVMSEGVHA